jgi:hypothetical protein
MPVKSETVDQIYKKMLGGEKDISEFDPKDISASKSDLDATMQNKPELVKALLRVGVMKSTGVMLEQLKKEAHDCVPIMRAVSMVIANTLEWISTHDAEQVDPEFFATVIKTEIDRAWLDMQAAFADHLKANKQEN